MGLFGLLILIPLWPGQRQGQRLLRRWGITGTTEQDVADAVTYLRRRRFWYPWLFMAVPGVAARWFGVDPRNTVWNLLVTVLVGTLVAEILAQRRVQAAQRSALLIRRRVGDLVPTWALIVFGFAVAITVVRLVTVQRWSLLAAALATMAVAGLVVLLAVRRPAVGRPEVDLALRTRSARVAVGLGIAVAASLAGESADLASQLLAVFGLASLLAIAQPDRPHLARGAA
jgi:hypothetical protein